MRAANSARTPKGDSMFRPIEPLRPVRRNLCDPRSTGAAPPVRVHDVLALRGTFKGRP